MDHRLPEGYRWVITEDGSQTLYSPLFDENCHSTAGAVAETLYTYIKPNKVLERISNNGKISLLEVGWGTGLGFKTTMESLSEYPLAQIDYLALEIDPVLIANCDLKLETIQLTPTISIHTFQSEFLKFRILQGDARQSLPYLKTIEPHLNFDVIYQDAFSPKRNPTLWTYEWFAFLASFADNLTTLSTYSAAKKMQKALVEAGWGVSVFPGHGMKSKATFAQWNSPTSPELIDKLKLVESFKD